MGNKVCVAREWGIRGEAGGVRSGESKALRGPSATGSLRGSFVAMDRLTWD